MGLTRRPLYLQVHDMLVGRISVGAWKPGAPIPSEQEIARELQVSHGTVRKALEQMESQHIIRRAPGRGTFVADFARDEAALRFCRIYDASGRRLEGDVEQVVVKVGRAGTEEQNRLELAASEKILRITRLRRHAGRKFMLEHAALPAPLFAGLETDAIVPHKIPLLAHQFGHIVTHYVESVQPHAATQPIAEALSVELGTPLLKLDRVAFLVDRRPVEWRIAWCHLIDEKYVAEY